MTEGGEMIQYFIDNFEKFNNFEHGMLEFAFNACI